MPQPFNVVVANNSLGFREAAEAIHHGLLEAGHDSVLTGPEGLTSMPGHRRIVFAIRLGKLLRESYADTDWRQVIRDDDIVYNSEQLRDELVARYEIGDIVRERAVWDYSANNIDYLRAAGCRNPVLVPLGYVDALRRIPRQEYDTDVMFYGLMNPRRQAILDALRDTGLRCRFHDKSNHVWGDARDALIGRSKIVLNIHFYEYKILEVFRVFYPLLNGKCVISETGADPAERFYRDGLVLREYEDLVETCQQYANDDRLLRDQEERAAATMRAVRQADILRRALAES